MEKEKTQSESFEVKYFFYFFSFHNRELKIFSKNFNFQLFWQKIQPRHVNMCSYLATSSCAPASPLVTCRQCISLGQAAAPKPTSST